MNEMRYSQIIIQMFYLYASHFHKSLVSPGQLAEDVVPVDHDLLVPLAPSGHPAGLHTQALDIVSVILRLVHLVAQARLQPPNPQGAIEAGGKHEAGVEDTHTLTSVLVTLEQPEVRDVVTCQNNIRNLRSSRLCLEKTAISGWIQNWQMMYFLLTARPDTSSSHTRRDTRGQGHVQSVILLFFCDICFSVVH